MCDNNFISEIQLCCILDQWCLNQMCIKFTDLASVELSLFVYFLGMQLKVSFLREKLSCVKFQLHQVIFFYTY